MNSLLQQYGQVRGLAPLKEVVGNSSSSELGDTEELLKQYMTASNPALLAALTR